MTNHRSPQPARICPGCGEYEPHACAGIVRLPRRLPPVSRRRALLNRTILRGAVTPRRGAA